MTTPDPQGSVPDGSTPEASTPDGAPDGSVPEASTHEASAPDGEGRRALRSAVEAVVLASPEPVEPSVIAQLLEISRRDVEALADEMARDYEAEGRGFVLARVAGGLRFQTHPDQAPYVERFVLEGQRARLSGPALETLAIVAYKQPVSRAQIAAIRGVNVESVVNTLLEREYIHEVGRDPGPGNAVLYGTTPAFLEHLGLDSLGDLPPLVDFVPGAEIVETLEQTLLVSDSGTASPVEGE